MEIRFPVVHRVERYHEHHQSKMNTLRCLESYVQPLRLYILLSGDVSSAVSVVCAFDGGGTSDEGGISCATINPGTTAVSGEFSLMVDGSGSHEVELRTIV